MDVAFSLVMDRQMAEQVERFRQRENLDAKANAIRKLVFAGLRAEGIE